MRFILLVTVMLLNLSHSVRSQHNFFFKYGRDLSGTHEIGPAGDEISDNAKGQQFSAELAFPIAGAEIGGGAILQSKREAKEWEGKFNFISYYGLIRVNLGPYYSRPYIGARVGPGVLQGNSHYKGEGKLNGGIYYSFFGGYCYKFLLFELAYEGHEGSWKLYDGVDIGYSHVSFSVGFRLPGTL